MLPAFLKLFEIFMEFNPEQLRVIGLNEGEHTVLASAGSGKTEVLTERLKQAIEKGIEPEKMLCLTFTNRAALSMTERIAEKIGEISKGVFIGNTHALALNLINKNKLVSLNESLVTTDYQVKLWKTGVTRKKL